MSTRGRSTSQAIVTPSWRVTLERIEHNRIVALRDVLALIDAFGAAAVQCEEIAEALAGRDELPAGARDSARAYAARASALAAGLMAYEGEVRKALRPRATPLPEVSA